MVITMKKEIWKPIKGYEGLYEVSNLGRIKSLKRKIKCNCGDKILSRTINEKILNFIPSKNGYLRVNLFKNKIIHTDYVHRIVAKTFIQQELSTADEVNHKNKDKTNNQVDNLEVVSKSENGLHRDGCKVYKVKGIISFLKNSIYESTNPIEREAYIKTLNFIKNKNDY